MSDHRDVLSRQPGLSPSEYVFDYQVVQHFGGCDLRVPLTGDWRRDDRAVMQAIYDDVWDALDFAPEVVVFRRAGAEGPWRVTRSTCDVTEYGRGPDEERTAAGEPGFLADVSPNMHRLTCDWPLPEPDHPARGDDLVHGLRRAVAEGLVLSREQRDLLALLLRGAS